MANQFVAAAVVAGAVFSATPSFAQSNTTQSSPTTFNICVGGFWNAQQGNKCDPYDIYVFCLNPDKSQPPYKNAAKDACKGAGKSASFTAQTLRFVPDNRCGYTNILITCNN
jgi:hypothetical protein